jgi:alkanesulfonate monooxygenase SsuD/methylene tetrahydromethanopterin reductase-like flavin-dependent oxidoreductase (luciferase family)
MAFPVRGDQAWWADTRIAYFGHSPGQRAKDMQVGIFDHVERADRPMATTLNERLTFAAAADAAGIYCLHVAEHHATPLNLVPVPGIWLGALARATSRMRLGPLVYLLPLYSPLRLAEEICILDNLSNGRLEVGVGRGVSPFELGYHKVAHADSREIFVDAYACLVAALTQDPFSYSGKHYAYANVPMALRPLQQPHPPFWYGSSNTTGAAWSGEHGMHFVANGPTDYAKVNIEAYRSALAQRGGPAQPKPEFSGGAVIGALRHIVVAETDAEARAIAKPNVEYHVQSLNWLRKMHATTEADVRGFVPRGITFEEWETDGMAIAGTPTTVVAEIERQAGMLGINYLLSYLFFGTMTLAQALRSLELMRSEVMPRIAHL